MRRTIARALAAVLALVSMAAFAAPAGAGTSGRGGCGITTRDVTALDFFDRYRNQATGRHLDHTWDYGLRTCGRNDSAYRRW